MRRQDLQKLATGLISLLLLTGLVNNTRAQQQYPSYPGYAPYPYAQPQQPYARPLQQQTNPQQQGYGPPRQPAYGQQTHPWPQQPYQNQAPQGSYGQAPYQYQPRQPQQPELQPPAQQTWPQAPAYSYRQAPTQSNSGNAPKVEIEVFDRKPYTQQTILLTLRIISSSNLGSAQPELTGSGPFVFKKLNGPVASARASAAGQEIVNEYRYALTPLQAGQLMFPRIRVKGTLAAGQGQPFDVLSSEPIVFDVQPASPAVQPWLPLHGLVMQSFLQGAEKPEAGKPISLVVYISAIGATGSQLPSFEQDLQSTDFHVYREKSDAEGSISTDGRFLLGQRSETFTLVPLHGGKIQIPALSINWWNVDTGSKETTSVPIRQLVAKGEPGSSKGQVTDLFPGASSMILWVPLIGLFSLTIGFWLLAWLRQKRFIQVVEEEIAAVLSFSARRLRAFLAWIAPIRRLQKVRQVFVRSLPSSFRLWFCARVVDGESDPEVWSYMLKFLANKHLGIPPQLPLREMAERLSAKHPRADKLAMRALMQELEASLYGDGSVDFQDWKRRFRAQIKPTWLPFFRSKTGPLRSSQPRLPQLNPGSG